MLYRFHLFQWFTKVLEMSSTSSLSFQAAKLVLNFTPSKLLRLYVRKIKSYTENITKNESFDWQICPAYCRHQLLESPPSLENLA